MSKPIIVANWKNNPNSLAEAKLLLKELGKNRLLYKKVSFFVASPLTYFEQVLEKASGFAKLASQDFPSLGKGTFTGAVTADILRSFGVRLSIIGHSERRALGESDQDVSKKAKLALKAGIAPLVCVGEKVHDHDGEHFEVLRQQIEASLAGLSKADVSKLVLAYEPVWAIGKSAKDAVKPAELAETAIYIRKVLADLYGQKASLGVPILYGGSVEPSNAESLWRETGVSGFLIGRASRRASDLKKIVEETL